MLGLSDLGRRNGNGTTYDDCYVEDRDNQIDVVLDGDIAATRSIRAVEMPGLPNGYGALYNPGCPGPTPFPDVTYSAPSPPPDLPVITALDDPMQVSR